MVQLPALTSIRCRYFPRQVQRASVRIVLPAVAAFLMSCFLMQAAHAKPAARPNIILIMADDIGYECFGCYGSRQYKTPRIDALAKDGIRMNRFHAQPLCTPTRVKLMTGMSNVRNYSAFSVLPRDQKTIGEYFREAGYRTAIGGKWQLLGARHYSTQFRGKGTWPREAGFEKICLWQVDELGSRYWKPLLYVDGANHQYAADQYGPDIVCEQLLQFMRTHRDEPFFVYYPMILVHNPFEMPPTGKRGSGAKAQQRFEAMVTHMDTAVGRVVDEVDRLGIAEKTLIIFLGDNGTNKAIRSKLGGRVIRGGKGQTTDAGTHVPFVARWPGHIPAGTNCDDLADVSDILPTLAEIAGIELAGPRDGQSFAAQLAGKPGKPREWLYCYYNPRPEKTSPQRFAFDKHYKLYADGRFYDLQSDVEEKAPLDDWRENPAAAAAYRKLKAAIDSFPDKGQKLLQFPKDRAAALGS